VMRLKFWLIAIESALLVIAITGIAFALNTWRDTAPVTMAGGCQETISVGKSVNGVEITACRLIGSEVESENALLVIGTVHGDEPDGKRIVDELLSQAVPADTEIWVLRDANPDGAELVTRKNANEVDINRNFPANWVASDPLARTYSGPSPASEPETLALMSAVRQIQPTRIVVFHQPYAQIDCPPERLAKISDRLSQLTGYKSECIPGEKSGSPTNSYTGTFTIWVNSNFPKTTAVTFELGLTTMQAKIKTIAKALRVLASDE
jgi:protein MpaA